MMSDRTVPSRNRVRVPAMSLVIDATNTSSRMNGATRAAAKGHPRVAPMPNHMIPCAVLMPPLQSRKAAVPSIVVYMAKVDGRYAVDA